MNVHVHIDKLSDKPRPIRVQSRQEVHSVVTSVRQSDKRVGFVPTMGALHAGHLSLVAASRAENDFTVVSIFVNPMQFGPEEDFHEYPRSLPGDLDALCAQETDLVFMPSVDEVYRPGHETYVEVGSQSALYEGTYRPGHFRGVATVVLKLLNLVPAHRAYFGEKDYQQSLVVRQLVRDLDLPVTIRVCPTIRDPDGLAISSRNAYLSPQERQQARAFPESLRQAAELARSGERRAAVIQQRVENHLRDHGVDVHYVAMVKDGTVDTVTTLEEPARVLIAGAVGQTRLIDNRQLRVER